jgi:exonuclease SbcC
MRPLKLRVEGVRSYRAATEIEFPDANLMAIVGDTGAGKSSLLEGITYALYGWSTWSGQAGDLISDHATTMTVELTFRAEGRTWVATRSMSRGAYPPPIHKLECRDDHRRVDGKSAVTRAVEDLLGGLDVNGFLRTVILPQGRFAQVLTATKTERDGVLKNIFRVDHLEAARERARVLLEALRPQFDALKVHRMGYLEDPAASENDALRRLSTSEERAAELSAAAEAISRAEADSKKAMERGASIRSATETLRIDEVRAASAVLLELAEEASELDRRIVGAEETCQQLEADVTAQRIALANLEQAHGGVAQLTGIRSALSSLTQDASDLLALLDEYDLRREEVSATEKEVARLESEALAAQQLESQARSKAEEARRLVARRIADRDAVREAVRRARETRDRARETADRWEEASAGIPDRELAAEEAAEELSQAEAELARTRTQVEELRKIHSAAHAAAGLSPGDSCPICARKLPTGFHPPAEPSLDAAEVDATHADAVAQAARGNSHVATAALEEAMRSAEREHIAHEGAANDLKVALAKLTDLTASSEPVGQDDIDGDALLDPFETLCQQAESDTQDVEEKATDAVRQSAHATSRLDEALTALGRVRREAERVARSRSRAVDRVTERLGAIPQDLRPVVPLLEPELPASDVRPALMDLDVSPQLTEVGQRLLKLDEARKSLDALIEAAETADRELKELSRDRRERVEQPALTQIGVLDQAAARLGPVAQLLAGGDVPVVSDRSNLSACADWGEALEDKARELSVRASEEEADLRQKQDEAEALVAETLAEVGLTDHDELSEARAMVLADRREAEKDLGRARRELPIVRELEQRLAAGQQFLDTVENVRQLLLDSAFVGAFIDRRQRSLLGVATTILGQMTRDRFGFSADFEVLDRWSGQPRSPRTLSGGESFMASLALALAMVELAARAGGRLEALFLDEGFGALDASSLEAALDALEERSRSGRLVAVISHVRAVAERIPNVLCIKSTATGTTASWLTERERVAVYEGEVTDAMAGLLS